MCKIEIAPPTVRTIRVPFANDAFPGEDLGVTFEVPEILGRPMKELRKQLRMIADLGRGRETPPPEYEILESWITYKIADAQAEIKAVMGSESEPAFHRALRDRERDLDALIRRRDLWRELRIKRGDGVDPWPPEADADTQDAAGTDTAAADTTTTQDAPNGEKGDRTMKTATTAARIDFFAGCRTPEDARKRYHALAAVYHTDTGIGDKEIMETINDQFGAWIGRASLPADAVPELPAGVIALPAHVEAPAALDDAAAYMAVIAALLPLSGIEVEITGEWVWISGDTRPVKDEIKAAGCRYSGKRQAWYWHPVDPSAPRRRYRGSKLTMDEIREKYGRQIVKTA